MSLLCRVCGSRNADGAQFCVNKKCGAYLVWEGQPTISGPDRTGLNRRRGLRVQLSEQTFSVAPGEVCAMTVTLHNTGNLVEGVRVMIGGSAAAWSTVEPAELSVYPERAAECTVTFAPPRGPQCPAGIVGFVVQCASTVHSGLVVTASGTIAVGAFHELTAQLTPTITRGRRRTVHQVRLENRGNVEERVRLTASGAEGGLTFEPADSMVDVVPGVAEVPLGVRARLHWFGRSHAIPIQATAVPLGGGPPLRADGTRHVVPLLPTWLLTGVLAVAMLGGGAATAFKLAGNEAVSTSPAVTPDLSITGTDAGSATVETTTTAASTGESSGLATTTTASSAEPSSSTTTTTSSVPAPSDPVLPKPEDCIGYDPAALHVVNAGAVGWQLLEGTSHAMLLLDNEADAKNAQAMAEQHKSMCFLGRDNKRSDRKAYIVHYWRGSSGRQTTITSPDCATYDPAKLRVVNAGADVGWQLMEGQSRAMVLLDSESDANKALTWAKAFTKQCFIGRANKRPDRLDYVVGYWEH
jgi:hypothetical protein